MSDRPAIVLTGTSHAQAIALLLGRIPALRERADVVYAGAAISPEDAARALVHFEQLDPAASAPTDGTHRRVTFPTVRFDLLWPLLCSNVYAKPDPPERPFGRFPYGDKFVTACIARGIPAKQIVRHVLENGWGDNWPDLDELHRSESRRIIGDDVRADVKIGSYVLTTFRAKRLFWTPNNLSNVMLAELTRRLIAAALDVLPDAGDAVDDAVTAQDGHEILGVYALPIHPHVATHFGLNWYRTDQRYAVYGTPCSYAEYFREFVEESVAVHLARG